MSYFLSEKQILNLLHKTILYGEKGVNREQLIEDIGQVVSRHFGGRVSGCSIDFDPINAENLEPLGNDLFTVQFDWDKRIPYGGGIFAKLDPDALESSEEFFDEKVQKGYYQKEFQDECDQLAKYLENETPVDVLEDFVSEEQKKFDDYIDEQAKQPLTKEEMKSIKEYIERLD